MKRSIFIVGITLGCLFCYQSSKSETSLPLKEVIINGIEDGWYKATVQYTNYSTGTNSNYTLKVYVQYDTVIKIDFGNGGSVHTGYNNEGYIYGGGTLSFETGYDGNITAATTTVTISDNNGLRYFKIRIE